MSTNTSKIEAHTGQPFTTTAKPIELPTPDKSAGAEGLVRLHRSAGPEEISRIVERDGACVIDGFLTPEQVKSFNEEVDPALKAHTNAADTDIPEAVRDFQGQNTKRLHGMTLLSKTFRDHVLDDDLLHGISKEMIEKHIGSYWLSTAQMMEIGPGQKAQPLHRDGGGWWPFYQMGLSSLIAYVNFLLALTNTAKENGATRFIPGSHKWPFTEEDQNTGTEDMTLDAELTAGDVLVITDRLVHSGGHNSTKDFYRRVVAISVTTSAYTQEEAHAHFIGLPLVKELSPRAQRFLGFRTQYPRGSPGMVTWNVEEVGKYLGLK